MWNRTALLPTAHLSDPTIEQLFSLPHDRPLPPQRPSNHALTSTTSQRNLVPSLRRACRDVSRNSEAMRVGIPSSVAPGPVLHHVADTIQRKQGIQRVELAHQANYHERLTIRII